MDRLDEDMSPPIEFGHDDYFKLKEQEESESEEEEQIKEKLPPDIPKAKKKIAKAPKMAKAA